MSRCNKKATTKTNKDPLEPFLAHEKGVLRFEKEKWVLDPSGSIVIQPLA